MKYLLDSDICIESMKQSRGYSIRERLRQCEPGDVVMASVVRVELLYGALHSRDAATNVERTSRFLGAFTTLSLDATAADHAADIRHALARSGTPIGPFDLLIAAIARSNALTLVTRNIREYARVDGLRIENWDE